MAGFFLWLRRGFLLSFLARSLKDSNIWRRQFLQTFVQRDIARLGFNIPAPALLRFWSSYAIEEVLKIVEPDEASFWRTHQGAELDLLILKEGRRFGVEIKRADAPTLTRSMRVALADLKLEHLTVLHPGDLRYSISGRVSAVPLSALSTCDSDLLFPMQVRKPKR